jgi:hypothetical protein
MSFALGDIIIDRIQYGWAEKFDGTPIYVLTQLSEGSLEITAESKDAVDNTGTLIKRFWQAKAGTFTATNAMISLPMLASNSGVDAQVVSDGVIKATGASGTITMPRIIKVAGGDQVTLDGAVDTSIVVTEILTNGAMGDTISVSAGSASATEYAFNSTTDKFTAPTSSTKNYLVRYDREVENGAKISNSADKFPDTVKLILKCLAVDPCEADTLKAMYLELPSFQPSPEITVGLQTDTTLDYTGELQVDRQINKSYQMVA